MIFIVITTLWPGTKADHPEMLHFIKRRALAPSPINNKNAVIIKNPPLTSHPKM
jgi:hypothetical protein